MWFAFMRKFSQVRRQHMLSLLGLYLWRNQPVSLLLPLPFMFSVKDWFFFFFPFFTLFFFDFQLYIAALCCIRVGFEKKPQAISGCGDRGDQSKESSMTYLTQCWGAGGEGAGFETHSPMKHFPVGVVFSTPHSHGTAISHAVVCQEAKMALLFSAELQWRVPRGVKMV